VSPSQESAEPVVVARPATEVEGAILRSALEGEGIPAWVVGGMTSGFRAEAPGRARLMVRAVDAARAREILGRAAERPEEPGEGE
jgi:hypothetical protein